MATITTHPHVPRVTSLGRGDIWIEPEVQQRACLDAATVQEYTALYQEGRDLGPLVVFRENDVYLLADGFHRYEAASFAQVTTLPVVVYDGTLRDALFYATSCNLHGKPLTNADKRQRVLTMLKDPEWAQWSDNALAKHCGVTQPFVGTVRKSLQTVISEAVPTSRTYQDKHGHVHTMETGKIGQHGTRSGGSGGETPPPPIRPVVQDPDPPEAAPSWQQRVYTGDPEWYTPEEILVPVRKVLGQIDVDPASCDAAQVLVQARTYYTRDDDGLRHPWHGTVYLNPPYKHAELTPYIAKLFQELDAGHTTAAILVVNSMTQTDWFQAVALRADAVCFPDGRIPFHHATKDGMHPCSGQAICYFGPQVARFAAIFVELGVIMQAMRGVAPAQLALAAPPVVLYDMAKFFLGKLCAGKHEWGTTGQTLWRKNGKYCQRCNTEKRRKAPRKETHGTGDVRNP